ncbi:hypothetical protein JHW43_007952 [Diplocarpon mali]|nr:hypothetical protein JHW43_007952 [Diplocarpon mali]
MPEGGGVVEATGSFRHGEQERLRASVSSLGLALVETPRASRASTRTNTDSNIGPRDHTRPPQTIADDVLRRSIGPTLPRDPNQVKPLDMSGLDMSGLIRSPDTG